MEFLIIANLIKFTNDPDTKIYLSPKPKHEEILPFSYEMTADTVLIAPDSKDMKNVIDAFSEFFVVDWGVDPPFRVFLSALDKIDELENIELLRNYFKAAEITHNQGYVINSLENSILIMGNTPVGVFYGLMTLLQGVFISRDSTIRFPALIIKDYPDMEIRGLSDDISRGQVPNTQSLKRNIRLYSKFKLNQYLLYIEDVFSFSKYPSIGKERGALTAAEINEVQEYAEKHFVEVIPIFQTLGHWENYFWTPEFTPYGEFPGGNSLDISNPKLYDFLEEILKEITAAFKSKYFHMGCDESWHVGLGKSKSYVEKIGLGNAYSKHYNWVISKLKEFGKEKIYLYHDIASKFKEVNASLPKEDLIYVFWKYHEAEKYPELTPIIEAKIPFVVSSSILNWCKIYPDIEQAERTNIALIKYGMKHGASGQIVSSWGDNGQENLRENNHYGFCCASAISWNVDGYNSDTFLRAFCNTAFGSTVPELMELFTLIKSSPKIMESQIFSNFFPHFWRHPFPNQDIDNPIHFWNQEYSSDFKEDAESHFLRMKQICQGLTNKVFRNFIFLDHIDYFADTVLTLIRKIQYTYKISFLCEEDLDAEKIADVEKYVNSLKYMYENLKERYEELWLYSAKRPRLDNILEYFDWMIYWLDSKLEELEMGIQFKYPFLTSDWIYHKEEHLTNEFRYFVKQFEIPDDKFEDIEEAWIQAIPSTFCSVFINGSHALSVPLNEGTTRLLMDSQVKIKEIKDLLRKGINIIAVEAQMLPKGIPAFNFLMEISYKQNPPEIIVSDLTWKSNSKKPEIWPPIHTPDKKDGWKRVSTYGKSPYYAGEITYPCFKLNMASKLTHKGFFAVVNFMYHNSNQNLPIISIRMQSDNPANKM
jgi:hypothetical protein